MFNIILDLGRKKEFKRQRKFCCSRNKICVFLKEKQSLSSLPVLFIFYSIKYFEIFIVFELVRHDFGYWITCNSKVIQISFRPASNPNILNVNWNIFSRKNGMEVRAVAVSQIRLFPCIFKYIYICEWKKLMPLVFKY